MMKKLLIVALLLGLATAASAALDAVWQIQLRATDLNHANSLAMLSIGTGTPSTASGTWLGNIVGVYIAGTNPPRIREIRAAEPANVTMEWHLAVTATSTYRSNKFKLHAWNPSPTLGDLDNNWGGVTGTQPYIRPVNPDPDAFFVRLYKDGVLLWTFNPTTNGTSATPEFTGVWDITPGGTVTGFVLKREPIPEPGSVLAVMSGLVGLAGFAIRRRR